LPLKKAAHNLGLPYLYSSFTSFSRNLADSFIDVASKPRMIISFVSSSIIFIRNRP
jgi:hypothetical protein